MADTFHCSVVTPENAILECDATFAAFPAHDGEIGIMPNRSALLCRLGIGVLRVESEGEKHAFYVDGGFAQMVDNKLTLLTEQARASEEIEHEAARQALDDARGMSLEGGGDVYDRRQKAIRRAQVQVELAPPEQ
ncbi:MAG: ATP synthase F1 subunit epsilon [bacterium]|nr:ATP synthase F1 subunit epsilon [bacterium]